MKAIIISDTHGQEAKLKIPDCDVLIHCGDFSNLGTEEELSKFAGWLKTLPHKHILLSPGNHDGMTQENPARAKEILENARSGVRLLLHEALELEGIRFFFSPLTPEYAGWWWMLEEPDLVAKWAEIPDDTEVLITHGPPKLILDTVERQIGHHAGSSSLYARIQQLPKLRHHFFGHLHHSGGQTVRIGGVDFTNAAVLDDRNHFRNQPQIYDLGVEATTENKQE